jgi:serine protease DegS
MRNIFKFITWPTIAGVLAALLILDRLALLPNAAGLRVGPTATSSYAAAVQLASPSVVNIYTAKLVSPRPNPLLNDQLIRSFSNYQSPHQQVENSLGSGVIMSDKGYILTNNHVIEDADEIQVLLHDGRSARAVVAGADEATDLAVLKIQLPDLQAIVPGNSNTALVGDVVLAIGNPLGFGHSVTQGIISGLGRYGVQANTYENYIQTDAAINQGNSGGALIDSQGKLLGINTLTIATNSGRGSSPTSAPGISLAIPVDQALFVMQDLIAYGEVIRGWLGVRVNPVNRTDSDSNLDQALIVARVATGSPAEKAGIERGDIITHLDNELVRDGRLTMYKIALLRPGDSIDVTVQRDQQSIDLTAVVGALRQSEGS